MDPSKNDSETTINISMVVTFVMFYYLQKENQELQSTIKLAQSELEIAQSTYESQKHILLTLNQQLASRIHELATIHDEMTTALQTWDR